MFDKHVHYDDVDDDDGDDDENGDDAHANDDVVDEMRDNNHFRRALYNTDIVYDFQVLPEILEEIFIALTVARKVNNLILTFVGGICE